MNKTVYYRDPLEDDFAGTHIDPIPVDETFAFSPPSFRWRFFSAVLYYLIAIPVLAIICYGILGFRYKNRKALWKLGRKGCFLFANHTHYSDAYLGPLVMFPKRAYVITSRDAVSIKGIEKLVQMLGAVPLPSTVKGMEPFIRCLQEKTKKGGCVTVFPEAHIWPYYTGIRPFKSTSLRYPVLCGVPVIAAAVTYQKRKGLLRRLKTPRRTVYISEPFYPKAELSPKENQKYLYEKARSFMEEAAAAHSDYAYVEYLPCQH